MWDRAGGTDSGQSSVFNDWHGLLSFRIMGRVSAGMTRYVIDLEYNVGPETSKPWVAGSNPAGRAI